MVKFPYFNKTKVFINHYFGGLYTRIDEHHLFLNASGLAFELFLCIIPFMLIIFAVLGSILASNNIQYQINLFIDTIIPYSEYSEFVKKIIFTRINEVIEYKTIAGIIGGFGLFFAASGLFSSMRTILNQVFGITKSVNLLLGKLLDFALVVMVILIFFLATICAPIIHVLAQSAGQFEELAFFKAPIFQHFFLSMLSFTIIFLVFSVLSITVPYPPFRPRY